MFYNALKGVQSFGACSFERGGVAAKGYFFILAAASCFGMMPVWAKLAYGAGLDPLSLILMRTAIAAITLLAFFLVGRRVPRVAQGSRSAVLTTCCLYAAMMLSYFYACRGLDSGVANALFHLYPVIVMALSVAQGKSRSGAAKWIAGGMALAGFALLACDGGDAVRFESVVLVVAAAVLFALYTLKLDTPAMTAVDPFCLTFYICLMSFATTVAVWLFGGRVPFEITASGFVYAALIGLFSTIFALGFYILATQSLGPTAASMLSNAEVVVTLAAGAIILGESATLMGLAGCALVVAACVLVCIREKARPQIPAGEGGGHASLR